MRLTIQKLFSVAILVSIMLVFVAPCAAWQTASRLGESRLNGMSSFAPQAGLPAANVSGVARLQAIQQEPKPDGIGYEETQRIPPVDLNTNQRIGAGRLSDLRSEPVEPQTDLPQRSPVIPPADLLTRNYADQSPQADQSYFDADQPPVVVVWLNSDLQAPLLSKKQLKQWMQSVPEHDNYPIQPASNIQQAEPRSWVQAAGFAQPISEDPPSIGVNNKAVVASGRAFAEPFRKFQKFDERLAAIRQQFADKEKQVADDESIDEISKAELSNLLNLTREWIQKAATDLETLESETKKKKAFETDKELQAQEDELVAEKKLADPKFAPPADVLPTDRSEAIDLLQKRLKEKEAELLVLTDKRSDIREQILAREKRINDLPSLQNKNTKEEDETKKLMEKLKDEPEGLRRVLKKLRLNAKLLSLEITEESLELEVTRKEQIGSLQPLELEKLTLQIKRTEAKLSVLHVQSDKLRDQEIKERLQAAEMALKEKLTQSTPALRELAEFNKDLASQLPILAKKSDELEDELINVRQLQKELDDSHERLKYQIDSLGPTASGIRVVEHRRSLISTGKSQNRLLELADRMQHKQTRKLALKERLEHLVLGDDFSLDALAAVEQQVFEQVKNSAGPPDSPGLNPNDFQESELYELQRQKAIDVANQLLATQEEYTRDLVGMFEDNIQKLTNLDAAHRALIDKVQEVKAFSDKTALWVRSAKPIELEDLGRCRKGLRAIWASDNWQGLRDHTYQNFKHRPYDAGLLALVIGTLLVIRRRLRWSHD